MTTTNQSIQPQVKVVYTNIDLTAEQLEMYHRKQALLAEIAKIDDQFWNAGIVFSTNPFYKWMDNLGTAIDKKLTNSRVVMWATSHVVRAVCKSIYVLQEITLRNVRLYSLEGKHLSRKNGEQTRMTWYTNPTTAAELGEYMGGLTGRLVYIDIEVDFCSEYSHRFYKRGDEAFILKGDLMKSTKRKWKYAAIPTTSYVAVGTEI